MEKDKMLQILVPAAALAAVVMVVALIVGQSSTDAPSGGGGSGAPLPAVPPGKKPIASVEPTSEGMTLEKPETTGPEWRDIGDGLKMWEVKEGDGEARIATTDMGDWHYTGWRPDGFIFDSSVRRGSPSPFSLTQVIVGWTRGLVGMKVGGIRRLYIPSALAYGSQGGGGGTIPPNTDLIFEVKLIRIVR